MVRMNSALYKGFTITPRTYQVRGTARWTLDILIGHRDLLRAFSGTLTYSSEAAAVEGCLSLGRQLIDSGQPGCSLGDLTQDLPRTRSRGLSRPDRPSR
jgi:hypothetical protein